MRRSRVTSMLLGALFILSVSAWGASSKKLPTMLVFDGTSASNLGGDGSVGSLVVEQLASLKNAEIFTYDKDLPAVRLAVARKKLAQSVADSPAGAEGIAAVMAATGSEYALSIQESVANDRAKVSLELFRLSDKGHWTKDGDATVAGSGGSPAVNKRNALVTATSSAVSQLALAAFGEKAAATVAKVSAAQASGKPASGPVQTTAVAPVESDESAVLKDVEGEYKKALAQAGEALGRKDTPNAISCLRQAVNLCPSEVEPRGRLAELYQTLGLTEMAEDELRRALLLAPDSTVMRGKLARMYSQSGLLDEATREMEALVRLDPKDVDARVELGDLYWNLSRVDDASKAYEEAARIAPASPLGAERLYKLYSARRMYKPAIEQLVQSRTITVGGSGDEARAKVLSAVAYDEFGAVLKDLTESRSEFDAGRLERVEFYQKCKDLAARIDALSEYLASQQAPAASKVAFSHAVMASSLLSQATASLVSFFETEKDTYLEQAGVYQKEASVEFQEFTKLTPGLSS